MTEEQLVRAPGLVVVVSGPSGVGKGTVVKRLLDELPDAALSVSATTRQPRPGEIDGTHYHFVDRDQFERLVEDDELLEWAEYAGNRYGTPRQGVADQVTDGRVVLLEIEVQGALQIRRKVPDALLVFLSPPSFDELERRLAGRGTETDEVRRARLDVARWELAQQDSFDAVVINADLDHCVKTVKDLITEARDGAPRT